MAESVRLLHPVELVGSTHEERVRVLSEALERTHPLTDKTRYDALFDCYLIVMAYESGPRA